MWSRALALRSERARRALLHLPQIDPGLAALSVWCRTVDSDSADTVTSEDTIHVGHTFEFLPLREQIGVLAHHILHIALRHEFALQSHMARDGAASYPDLFVLCADSFINECLLRGGHAVPRPAVRLQTLLDHLGEPAALSDEALSRIDLVRLFHQIRRKAEDAREYARLQGFDADIIPKNAALQTDRSAGEWRAHLVRASQGAGAAGRGIGTVLAHLASLPQSQTPWEQRLRGLLAKAATPVPRRTYRRPRSRWIAAEAEARRHGTARPVFEPAEDRSALRPRLVIGVDCSSSVDRAQLRRFAGEVIAITLKSNAETHLLCFDEEVFIHRRIEMETARRAFEDLPLRQGGGTSFVDVLGRAGALDPSLIVVLTDLQGPFGAPPDAPVIWASAVPTPPQPPFGDVIELVG